MEPEGSLPHLQKPATCPYPEPDQSSPSSQLNFFTIHFYIILPSKPRSSKWSFFLRFLHQNPAWTSPLPHACHMPHPPHSSRFDHPPNSWWGVQITKLLAM